MGKKLSLREKICAEQRIKIVKIFDTNENEPKKDVVLGEWPKGKVVLRIGEHRPPAFFPGGYHGRHLVIPAVYFIDDCRHFEIEEYLPGTLLSDLNFRPCAASLLPCRWQKNLIASFWEWQSIAQRLALPKIDQLKKLKSFLPPASRLIFDKQAVSRLLSSSLFLCFFRHYFPAKWKFSPDNLIAMKKGKIGFIDLKGVSRRHWGYDLGWFIWSSWFRLSAKDYLAASVHQKFLEDFFAQVYRAAPSDRRPEKLFFIRSCWYNIIERSLGALYDLSAAIPHARRRFKNKSAEEKKFINFLNQLLSTAIKRASSI